VCITSRGYSNPAEPFTLERSIRMSGSDFGPRQLVEMSDAMVAWLGAHQVSDADSPYQGIIYYPTEDRFCNRDTACAAAAFMRQAQRTGDARWLEQARCAREALLRIQFPNGGYPEMRGRTPSDGGSAVNTSIVADNLITAYSLGLEYDERDVAALIRMAHFETTLEWKPGAFYHDTNHQEPNGDEWGAEGSQRDCQNTTALTAMMLRRIHGFLEDRGAGAQPDWLDAAMRAEQHLIASQLSNGHWAYWVGVDWTDIGHHAMVIFHLAQAAGESAKDALGESLVRGGQWLIDEGLLQTKLGSKINWRREQSACVYFSHGYFLVAAALGRLSRVAPAQRKVWRREALEVLRYVRTDLWDNPETEQEGPLRLTEAGLRYGYAWFGQSLGWCLYLLNDLLAQLDG